MKETRVLALNGGSSSLKVALFRCDAQGETRVAEGAVDKIGQSGGRLRLRAEGGGIDVDRDARAPDLQAAVGALLTALADTRLPEPQAIGHRLVHGGPEHYAPAAVDKALLASLADVVRFAPLHLPAELLAIDAVTARYPGLPQVVCFDTAFHHDLPEVTRRLPLPRALYERGIRRYGFHGLSYEHVVDAVGPATLGRAVVAHLGSGASLAAIVGGAPHDTTMGLTPTGGILMGTRSGDLDPGVLLHLLGDGEDAGSLERMVNHESGLRGVSGSTSDAKALLEARANDPEARLAIEMFCLQTQKTIGGFAASMGGIDSLVFTGGIGEHSAAIRAEICAPLGHLGVHLDAERNAASSPVISVAGAPCTVRVVATDEERMIARHTARLVQGGATPAAPT